MSVISMRQLTSRGRFGNQIFMYMFLKTMALDHGYSIETPDWAGQGLFTDVPQCPIRGKYPTLTEGDNFFPQSSTILKRLDGSCNVDVVGNFLYHTSFYARYKDELKKALTVTKEVESTYSAAFDQFRKKCNGPLIGLHYRLGDYKNSIRLVAPPQWYFDVLSHLDPGSTLFVCSDEIDVANKLFKGVTSRTVYGDLKHHFPEFMTDFWTLQHCDIVLCSDSTFSIVACMLSDTCRQSFRPALKAKRLIEFDPWNTHVSDLRTRGRS